MTGSAMHLLTRTTCRIPSRIAFAATVVMVAGPLQLCAQQLGHRVSKYHGKLPG